MSPYLYVIATVLAVIPTAIIFKICTEKIKENPDRKERVQTMFFVGVALAELIPIILIVFGFIHMQQVEAIEELFIPGILILILMGFATFFMFLQRTFDVEKEMKNFMNTFAMIGVTLSSAIPIISIVSLMMMLPN
ncbi:hypothetical protein ACFFIS_01585 [Virgibacillus soli]|uniref:F0F1 ATP synthase subunit C n=1 Tax=Paracerasibacillus soli TaxID=480284 RepID=A0ABU5CSV8_9BACI|nr:hypothetical protein [Virgibacillus soli]MDY0409455.1 hypothetical protein [Virgibacillus soli]